VIVEYTSWCCVAPASSAVSCSTNKHKDKTTAHASVAVSCRPWALKLLANSLAPSIYGHDLIKEGLVLMLMGGMERVVNNMHIRWVLWCCVWV